MSKIVAIQGDHPSKLNPITDTSIFLAKEIPVSYTHLRAHETLR